MNDSAHLNIRRTRWSSDKCPLDTPRPLKRGSQKVEKRLYWLNQKLQSVNNNLEHLTAMANVEKQTLSSRAIDAVRFAKLLEEKDRFISQISRMKKEKNKPKSFKFKVLIPLPMKEYSGYNLTGLMLGPYGNTIREMEEKTGAKMSLRDKDGSHRRNIRNYDDIHMFIGANSQQSIDAAVNMVKELLLQKKHIKSVQLRELAKIKGTLKEEKIGFVWTRCDICGDLYHPASGCPLAATDTETVKKFHTGPGSLFVSYGDKNKGETQIMPTELVVNCPPSSLNTNIPNYPGFVVPPSTSNANASNYKGLATISPSYPELPSSSSASVVSQSSSHGNLPIPGHAAILQFSSNANVPNYPRPAPSPPSSMNLNLSSYSKNATFPSSSLITKLPNYTRYAAIPPSPINQGPVALPSSSSITNLSTHPVPSVVPPTSSKANLPSYPAVTAVPPSSNANMPGFPGFVAVRPSSSNANRTSFPGIASIPPPSSNINRSSYPEFAANPPASSNANIPSFPRFTAATPSSSNSNLSSYTGFAAIHPPSSNAKPPSFLSSSSNANLSSYVGLAAIPPPSSNAKPPSYPKFTAIPPPSSNGNLSSYTRLAPVPPSSSNANLPICTGLAAIPQEMIPRSNNWPGPSGSSLTKSSSSFLKSGYNSPVQTGSAPLQTSTPLGSNARILDQKKLVPTGAPPSPSPNFSKYPEFAATSLEIAVPNCCPHPAVPTLLESGTSETGQLSTFSSKFPGITTISKELASLPAYTGLAPPTSKANLPSYPESGSSFFKSSYNSLAQTGSVPFQSSASLGKNADILDRKKLELAVTATPLPPSNPNSRNYSNFAAIPPVVPERNFWPRPTVSLSPESGTSLPKSFYSSLNYSETKPLPSSAPLGSTGQAAVSSSHLPCAVSNELASFPGYPKKIDASFPFDRPVPSSSLFSYPSGLTSKFSGNR